MTTATLTKAPVVPPIGWFRDPELPELTPLTVTDERRVFGSLCGWGERHRGLQGYVTPPRSRTGYREFLLHAARVLDGDGKVRTVAVGNLTMGTGHASLTANLRQAVEHYDNSGSVVAQVAVGEDQYGIWFSGAILPDVDELRLRRFMSCGLSGDWRALGGGSGLELCAALAVPVPGFSAPRARVASGAPLALVAAGFVQPAARFGKRVADGWAPPISVGMLSAGKLTAGITGARIEIGKEVTFYPASGSTYRTHEDLADAIAARLEQRQRDGELSARHAALVAELDDTPAVVAALLAEVDDSPQRAAELFAELGDHD